ncbi:CMRF35-like molecule 8 isoform X2 [Seriola lalandi dorsalis]|uniref:CMRF35-like molecule 8 isoform X2 n=1 Tax=Seriola lalandi dorsalis TaxID=1841481 RepID=UPI000C6FA63E|nr:CMRF35-like molecule 8 isoform X2 [Seriola lalandi dorsalis]XP_056224912.1 CMRF35-like molecule 8 isoform X2 [Seriola aureovittata]
MGASWISWRTTLSVITILPQIRALTSVKTVTGVEGQTLSFRCEYSHELWNNTKYFNRDDEEYPLIRTDKHDQWERNGRFSLYDNTTGAFIIIQVDKVVPEDSGIYLCGVDLSLRTDRISKIQLNVPRAKPPENLTQYKLHMPLFLTAVMCVAAILFVCLFTLCLLWAVKQQRSDPHQNREASSDYETMMPGVETELEPRCTSFTQDCADLSPEAPPPPDLCSHFTSKHRESTVSLGLGDYVDVDIPGNICQYQNLDLSRLEEHVYHIINVNSSPKDGYLGVKPQINC